MSQSDSQFLRSQINKQFKLLNPDNEPTKAVWLISIEHEQSGTPAGLMTAAYVGHTTSNNLPLPPHVFVAPRCIAEKTHRIATDAEVKAYLDAETAQREENQKMEHARKLAMTVNVQTDPELMKLVIAMAEKLMAEKAVEKKK